MKLLATCLLSGCAICLLLTGRIDADSIAVEMLDPNLQVTTALDVGMTQPIGIVFLEQDDFLILEKASGQVKRVIGGVVQTTPVLDLPVNSFSERGLLSLVLHPDFPDEPFMYVRWTESSTGADSVVDLEVPVLGNRVDRFRWDGSALTADSNIIMMRALQTDNIEVTGHPGTANPRPNGNHNGGVMRFGPDGKLYIFMGDKAAAAGCRISRTGRSKRRPSLTTPSAGRSPTMSICRG